jgi:hypothetical protein
MEMKWSNVVVFALVVFGSVLLVREHNAVGVALSGLGQIGPGHTPAEKFHGFFVLGILLVTLVAIVRLVLDANGRNKDR